jgi:hypothetical protein
MFVYFVNQSEAISSTQTELLVFIIIATNLFPHLTREVRMKEAVRLATRRQQTNLRTDL